MRRNDVVTKKENGYFHGRVVRIIDDKALWICTGLRIHLTPIDELEKTSYKGRREWSSHGGTIKYFNGERVTYERPARFIHMTSLRKLKQRCTEYHGKNAWKTPLDYIYLSE